jgi:hypothetical protein
MEAILLKAGGSLDAIALAAHVCVTFEGPPMPLPKNIQPIDLMLGLPVSEQNTEFYESIKGLLMDQESRELFAMPAQYMFLDIPKFAGVDDFVGATLKEMDKHNIQMAMTGITEESEVFQRAFKDHKDRFFFEHPADPNRGMDEVRLIKRLHKEYGLKAVSGFPSGLCPQVPIDDKRWYPIYATCVELDIPFCCCVGVPGPRLPMAPQKVELVDEVCWFFPELKFVMRHGAEPWTELAVKLMLKYPNLYYSTSAFAPRHYPKDIIYYANTRGADKILYAGYFPMGLSLDRIFKDMQEVSFRDHVWPKFLRENAIRVFNLDVA